MRDIGKVAVLGAGTMGARIAAHLANAHVPCVLLDLPPTSLTAEEQSKGLTLQDAPVRNRLAEQGLRAALQSSPAAFFIPENARFIALGNLQDHLGWLKSCDWIIEAVVEDLEAKRELYRTVDAVRAPRSIISSNTSGISINQLAEGLSDDFRQHFLGTHFFNPPRYLRLLEVIPTTQTRAEVIETITRFGEKFLGKGVILAKDTPNFIANRIGTFIILNVLHFLARGAFSIEELDALTGPAVGLPKSGTFRTLDLVGLDVFAHVVNNLAAALPNDERRDLLRVPDFIAAMIHRGLLGDKTGQGFYKKSKAKVAGDSSEILTLDLKSFEYRQRQKPKLPALELVRGTEDAQERIRTLFYSQDSVGDFYRSFLGEAFHYTASRIPEISDDIVSVDRAMKWGFNWELGIFEMWDAVGVAQVMEQWRRENRHLPPLVEALLTSGNKTFYASLEATECYFDLSSRNYKPIPTPPGVLILKSLKARQREIRRNPGASLIDLGDGVIALEFHSKMNTLGPDTVAMIFTGLKLLDESFQAMVIGNQGANFSVGANLMLVLISIQEGEWDELEEAVRAFQNANMALKYATKPVVAAPFGLTLGGGVEITLHCRRARAAAETYMGLVEAGVGLVPAGGGTKEMLVRAMDKALAVKDADPFDWIKDLFATIGMAKVSTSAEEARKLGYLSELDSYSMNPDRQLAEAKQLALALAQLEAQPAKPRDDILVLGQSAFAKMRLGLHLLRRGGHISEHDAVVGTHLAKILSGGGAFTSPQRVSEQFLLDLERESFLSLCGERKTQERIQHMLKTGKPLRN